MALERHGKEWTRKEDAKLERMFYEHFSFKQMGEALNRTWFACKCRLARKGLIPEFKNKAGHTFSPENVSGKDVEQFRVPNPDPGILCSMFGELNNMCFNDTEQEEDTSNTFSNAELNIVTDWLKTRLSRVVCKLADGEHCFVRDLELNTVKELLETEIKVANNMKKMTVEEREKVCKRLC